GGGSGKHCCNGPTIVEKSSAIDPDCRPYDRWCSTDLVGRALWPGIARKLRRCRPRPSDQWHLDEMVVRIAGRQMYLWCAVDHAGEVLDMLVQRRRNKRAAFRLMRKLLRKQGFAPKLLTTDKLGSYGSAFRHLRLSCPHEQGLRANNRAENSHQVV